MDGTDHDLVARLASIQTIPYSRWRYFCFSFGLYRAAARMIQAGEVDFIFADFEKSGFYAFLLRRRFGIPYVYNSHNVEFLRYVDIGRSNPSRYLFVPYLCLAEWIACRQALFTISISHKDASTFARWLPPERLSVMPCAFDESSLHPHYVDLPEVHPVVLLVGNYRNAGNRRGALHIFREVLPLVLQRRPETIFRFVGKDLPKEIHHPNVEALDFVEDLFDQYRRATVVIAPIEIGGGIKIKVVEALAAGRFVVATEKAMEGIPAGDFENLRVTPLDSFADAIIEALGSNCGKTTRNYDRLCAQFGTQTQLSELTQRIERELTLPTDCVH